MRSTSQWPMRSSQIIWRQLGPRLDESVIIEGDTTVEPSRARSSTRHDEHVTNVFSFRRAVVPSQVDALEVIFAFEGGDFRPCVQSDPRILFNASDQVSRHGVGQTIGSYEHVDVSCRLGEGHGSLASCVAAANDANLFTGAQLRLDERGAVVHAGAFELGNILEGKFSVFRACRDDDGSGDDFLTV